MDTIPVKPVSSTMNIVLGRIMVFARDKALSAEQVEQIFDVGSAAYQTLFGQFTHQSADKAAVNGEKENG